VKLSQDINIIVWPEWGFSPEEIESISAHKVYFGERILRCETVGEVVWFYVSQKK
jgi:16S rRNA U1498 N3-methylase RsmE